MSRAERASPAPSPGARLYSASVPLPGARSHSAPLFLTRSKLTRPPLTRSLIASFALAWALVGCSDPGTEAESLDFADWTIAIPEGTPVLEYPAVPEEERTEFLGFEADLVMGEASVNPDATFFRPRDVAVDEQGRIYVLDQGASRVQVVGPDGEFLHSMGREGQGPGEFRYPLSLSLRDERLAVADGANARLSFWDLDGTHRADVSIDRNGLIASRLALFGDDSALVDYSEMSSRTEATGRVTRIFWSGGDERTFVEVPAVVRIPFRESRDVGDGIRIAAPMPTFVMTPTGDFYVAGRDEYQVLAMSAAGDPKWALRVAHPKQPFSDAYIDAYIERLRAQDLGLTASHLEPGRPEHFPALARILTDARGRLYVVPYAEERPGEPLPEHVAVDVYTPEGERIFSGWMPNKDWRAARDNFVYVIETDPDTDERVVVRYRLVTPFD